MYKKSTQNSVPVKTPFIKGEIKTFSDKHKSVTIHCQLTYITRNVKLSQAKRIQNAKFKLQKEIKTDRTDKSVTI